MIPELGQFALILAFCLAVLQILLPLLKSSVLTRPLAFGQVFFIFFAYSCLTIAFISNDFSVAYVANNSNIELPLFYRVTGVWGAHEGSLLLWITILAIWMLLVTVQSKKYPEAMRVTVLSVLALVNSGFLLFILLTSNPFKRYLPVAPLQGVDLNPLLQDIGLAIHPPMLYMGYVGFAVVFAFAIAALVTGRLDATWVRWVRTWVMGAWCFLTLGIVLGSWWAYRVLGWGGWWFWDPVENASLLPWLTGTALFHGLLVTEKNGQLKTWIILLAIVAFVLSLLGTFLVRSGILISVHAFADDPARGRFLLIFLAIIIFAALLLYALRAHKFSAASNAALLSRETFLLFNNIILIIMMSTVLLGTLYPLILDALNLGKLSVGAPYFNTVFIPLGIPMLVAMGIGPLCYWQQIDSKILLRRLIWPVGLILAIIFLFALIKTTAIPILVILGTGLASWILVTTLQHVLLQAQQKITLRLMGMVLAHLGVAVCLLGITLTSQYKVEREVQMQFGDVVNVGAYQFKFLGLQNITGPNYQALDGIFQVNKNNSLVNTLHAEKRIYNAQQTGITIAAIDAGIFRDLYIALGDSINNNTWAVRIYYKPFVRWIWCGGLLMLMGGFLVLIRK